jgi:hypothetical protein
MLFQKQVEPRPSTPAPGAEGFKAREGEDDFNHDVVAQAPSNKQAK